MKFNKFKFALPFFVTVLCLGACGNPTPEGPKEREEYYDTNWTPGENAIKGAVQPEVKNPKGITTTLNEIRRTQNKVGLPAQGEGNILVVPVNFKNDDQIQIDNPNLDLTFDETDIENINKVFFGNDEFVEGKQTSVKQYYEISSYGKLNLNGVVAPVVNLPNLFTDYLIKGINFGIETVQEEIAAYVYDYLFEETKTYYVGDFDADNDKRVDYMSIIINYPTAEIFQDPNLNAVLASFASPTSFLFTDSLLEPNKTMLNSFSIGSDYHRFIQEDGLDAHIQTNFVGRSIGLDNYLDEGYSMTTGYSRAPLGYMDMMSGMIGDHNAFSKMQLGWVTPRYISPEDIGEDGLEITIQDLTTSGDVIVLNNGKDSIFGEYLVLEMVHPSKLNKFYKDTTFAYNNTFFTNRGVRVLKVNSTLLRGYESIYTTYEDEIDFSAQATLPNGRKVDYVYDYAYTNNSVNNYYSYGITSNNTLVGHLSPDGLNRHFTYSNDYLDNSDLFKVGDKFGKDNTFYEDFSFDGNGVDKDLLGIEFEITEFINNKAVIKFWRAK